MTDGSVPAWGNGGTESESGSTDWRDYGQDWVHELAARGGGRRAARELEQLVERLSGEFDRARAAVEQAQVVAGAADERAEVALADARAARDAVEELRAQVARQEQEAVPAPSGTPPAAATAPSEPAFPEPDDAGDAAPAQPRPAATAAARERDRPATDDPLADALVVLSRELREAAEARARGELDARAALRLLRSGFHTAQRTLSRVQREELRRGR